MAWRKILAVAVAAVAAPLMFASPVAASSALDRVNVAWTASGANEVPGVCNNVGPSSADLNPGPAYAGVAVHPHQAVQQQRLGACTVASAFLRPVLGSPVNGVHKGGGGGGTYHYAVYVPIGAT